MCTYQRVTLLKVECFHDMTTWQHEMTNFLWLTSEIKRRRWRPPPNKIIHVCMHVHVDVQVPWRIWKYSFLFNQCNGILPTRPILHLHVHNVVIGSDRKRIPRQAPEPRRWVVYGHGDCHGLGAECGALFWSAGELGWKERQWGRRDRRARWLCVQVRFLIHFYWSWYSVFIECNLPFNLSLARLEITHIIAWLPADRLHWRWMKFMRGQNHIQREIQLGMTGLWSCRAKSKV